MRIVRSGDVAEITLLVPLGCSDQELARSLRRDRALTLGPLRIDAATRTAWIGGRRLPLTPREYDLLDLLARRDGERVTRETLLAEIWGAVPSGSNLVAVHLSRLRAKLGDARAGVRIERVREGGWRLTHTALPSTTDPAEPDQRGAGAITRPASRGRA